MTICPFCGTDTRPKILKGEKRKPILVVRCPICHKCGNYLEWTGWIDPAGGYHSHNELDPLRQYE